MKTVNLSNRVHRIGISKAEEIELFEFLQLSWVDVGRFCDPSGLRPLTRSAVVDWLGGGDLPNNVDLVLMYKKLLRFKSFLSKFSFDENGVIEIAGG